jgi:hypothetical protein
LPQTVKEGNEKAIKQTICERRQEKRAKTMLNKKNFKETQCTVNHFFICLIFSSLLEARKIGWMENIQRNTPEGKFQINFLLRFYFALE